MYNSYDNQNQPNQNPGGQNQGYSTGGYGYGAPGQGQQTPPTYEWNSRGEYRQVPPSGPYYTPPKPPKAPKKKKDPKPLSRRAGVAIIAGSLVLSMGVGFGGGILAGQFFPNGMSGTTENRVIYQSDAGAVNTSTGDALTVAQIAEIATPSVVEITTEEVQTSTFFPQYIASGAGSGVIITDDGYIITNNHVVEGATKIKVRVKDGTSYDATLVGNDPKTDIAVIKIEATGLTSAVFGDSDTLTVGETAVAVGNPLGQLGGTVTNGIISALDRQITVEGETMTLLQTNAAISPGNSGGGLFNSRGELIGIVNAKSSGSDVEGLGFAIPANTAKSVAKDLMDYGYVQGRAELGFTLLDITDVQTAMMYRVTRLGVYVLQVNEGSAAEQAGFRSGDCILSMDGQEITSADEIKAIIEEHNVGDVLEAQVARGNDTLTLQVTIGQYKPSQITQ